MPAPLLTIVTVTYNDPQGLAQTWASLAPLLETNLPWEWIVVDSSPDATREPLRRVPASAPLTHLHKPPRGIYAAMNEGWRVARGRWVWFLNGGDRLHDAANLSAAVDAGDASTDCGLVISAADLCRDGAAFRTLHPSTGIFSLLGRNRVCHQAVLFSAELLRSLNGFPEKYRLAADYDLLLRARAFRTVTLKLDRVIVDYDMGGQSSDWEKAMTEFAEVHRDLAARGLLSHRAAHRLARGLETARIRLGRAVLATAVGPALRRFWHRLRN